MNYAYLHGFASSSKSEKGQKLAEILADDGIELMVPDLNSPSFEKLTYTGMLETLDALDDRSDDEPWRFIGSSVGGYIACRWAELNPGRVDRMLLLSPGFDMVDRWAEILGESGIEDWRDEGNFLFFDAEDNLAAVHWGLYQDAQDNHPAYPAVDLPIRILHGKDDEIVPVDSSETFVEQTEGAELFVLDDNHKMYDSVEEIAEHARDHFGLEDR